MSCLVLNATMEPISVVTVQKGLRLMLRGKVEVLEKKEFSWHSERQDFDVPSVVVTREYHTLGSSSGSSSKQQRPRNRGGDKTRRRPPVEQHAFNLTLNLKNVMRRDNCTCQYCGAEARSMDHVVPRSKGGGHTWANVVAACIKCNGRKGAHLLEETSLRLSREPTLPSYRVWAMSRLGLGHDPKSLLSKLQGPWVKYLQPLVSLEGSA